MADGWNAKADKPRWIVASLLSGRQECPELLDLPEGCAWLNLANHGRLLGLSGDRGRSGRRQLRRQGPHENTRVEPSSTVGHGAREELNFQQFPEVLDRGDVDGGHSVAVARFRAHSRHLGEAPRHQSVPRHRVDRHVGRQRVCPRLRGKELSHLRVHVPPGVSVR